MEAAEKEIGLEQYWLVIKRRWLPAAVVFGASAAAVSFLGFMQTPVYEAMGKLRFKSQDTTTALTGLAEGRGQLQSLDVQASPIPTEIGLMQASPLIRETIEKLNLRDEAGDLVEVREFLSGLDIASEEGTDLLRVTYQSTDPAIAKWAVDTVIDVYMKQHLLDNRAEAIAAREFIETQLPDAESRVRQAEVALRNFKEQNQIVSLGEETLGTVNALGEVETRLTDLNAQISDVAAQFNVLRQRVGRSPEAAIVAAAIAQSDGIQQILVEYQTIETALAAERVRFQDNHPVVQDLIAQLNNLDRVLAGRIGQVVGAQALPSNVNLQAGAVETALVSDYIRLEAQLNGLQDQAFTLQNARALYETRASALPRLEQEQRELERRVDAAQTTYNLLLNSQQEVRVAENQSVGNVRIVQPAEVNETPVAPQKKLYIVAGILLGSLLAVTVALLLEARDRSIKTVGEIKESLGFPILGVIPSFEDVVETETARALLDRDVPRLVTHDANSSLASEAFHMLRSNLKFLDSDNPPKVIAVTSTVPKEGKSTVASNLAASLAHTGKQVLLIDADLHHPIQHWIWDMSNRDGLSDLLVDRISLTEALLKVKSNFVLLLAGSVPPDPAALLDSEKMSDLLAAFKTRFDYIVVDTPALSSGASTSVLGKMADGLLLVVRPRVASKTSVNYAKELIDRSQQNVLGVVVNGALSEYEPYGRFFSEEFYGDSKVDADTEVSGPVEVQVVGGNRTR